MKRFVLFSLLILYTLYVGAVPACPDSVQVMQPDGSMIWTQVHGDEFYNWRSTTDGYVILRDLHLHYCYAIVNGDSLMPSNIVVHNASERTEEENTFLIKNTNNVRQFISIKQQRALAKQQVAMDTPLSDNSLVAIQSTTAVVGKRKILTVLVGFKDRPFTKTATDFDKLMNSKTGSIDGNYGSVWQFYNEDSYGKLDLSAVVVGPFVADNESEYYRWGKTDSDKHVKKLVNEAVDYAKKLVDFSTLDGDGDGYVDCIHVVFAGHGLSGGADDGLIWAHKSSINRIGKINGKKISKYIITPELANDNRIAPIGTICHELGHILGAPDFYDRIDDANDYNATGRYDLMGGGNWNYPIGRYSDSGRYPAHNNAYTKCYLFGWGNPKMLDAMTNNYTLLSATVSPVFYRINSTTNGEFFLLENRTKQNFDAMLSSEGLVIYHIHKDLASTIEQNEFINSNHPLKCYIVNAFAIKNPTNDPLSYGTNNDLRTYPGNNGKQTLFTIGSTPSFIGWNGVGTGVNICFIKQNLDKSVSFTVNPQIEGPDHLCGKRTYSVTGVVPAKDTIVWSYSFSSTMKENRLFPAIKFPNGNKGASVMVERGAQFVRLIDSIGTPLPDTPIKMSTETTAAGRGVLMPYTGTVTLYATIHSGNGTYTIEKEIELPKNAKPGIDLPIGKKPLWFANQTRSFTETAIPTIEDAYIRWHIQYPKDTAWSEYTGRSVSLTPTKGGTLTMRVVNDCGCPTLNEATYMFDISEKIVQPPIIMKSYQNPVNTSSIAISIERNVNDETDVATFAVPYELPNYTIELWSDLQGRVRTLTSNAENVSLDVAGLPNGWYQLLLLQDGQLLDSGNVLLTH